MPYTIDELKMIVSPIAKEYGTGTVYVFGSYSKGVATHESDLDLMIEKGNLKSLYQITGFRLAVEDAVKIPVDIVTTESSGIDFLNAIEKDKVVIYETA